MKQKTVCVVLLLIACASPVAAASIVQLTNDSAINSYPYWSPDGEEFAFTSFDGNNAGIRVMEPDGRNLRQVTDNRSWEFAPFDPWSPDGKALLFLSISAGKFDIWTMKPDGTGRVRLTEGGRIIPGPGLSGYGADWSADGKQIVYTSCLFDNAAIWKSFFDTVAEGSPAVNFSAIRKEADIWIMDADGSNKRQLTTGGDARSPQWQPHGDTIAYLADTSGNREIWITQNDGTGKRQVTCSEGNVSEYMWSPDGGAFVYVVAGRLDEFPEFSLWTTTFDWSGSMQVTSGNWDQSPVWSPDGSRLAFTSESRTQTALWVMKSDGSDITALTPGTVRYFMQQWSPDGKTIVVSDGDDLYRIPFKDQTAPASPGFEICFAATGLFFASYLRKRQS